MKLVRHNFASSSLPHFVNIHRDKKTAHITRAVFLSLYSSPNLSTAFLKSSSDGWVYLIVESKLL